MKILRLITILLISINSYSQSINFRQVILKSELILVGNQFTQDTLFLNDYSKELFIAIKKVGKVLKGKPTSNILKVKKTIFDDNLKGKHIYIEDTKEIDKKYFDIFFIAEDNLIAYVVLDDDEYKRLKKQVKTLSKIETNIALKERYNKTLKWFLENNLVPDKDFVTFYKQQNIIVDKIQYSEKQYEESLKKFEKGFENLQPIVEQKYPDRVKKYYLNKMKKIIGKHHKEYNDYYQFGKAFNSINKSEEEAISILRYSLTTHEYDEYDKERIMEYLLKLVIEQ